jgi:hypothetical protein
VDWVQVIGYQHESVHAGVLRHLLEGPQAIGVARALTGDRRISAVIDPRPEVKFRR